MSPRPSPTPNAPEPAARFRADCEALTGAIGAGQRLGIAVSGGPDSLALLLLAAAAWPGQVAAATVDHGLRPESAGEAAMVARLCRERGIPHAVLHPASPITGSIQAAARKARYAALDQWAEADGIDWLMTAHHADDQAETLLMRLNRGAGPGGLAGVRARRGRVIRPLLGWRRSELAVIVAEAGLAAVDDPANADPRFDRARMRAAIAEAGWLNIDALARSAAALGEAEAALEWIADSLAASRLTLFQGAVTMDPDGLPAEIRRRLILRAIRLLDPDALPRGAEISRLLSALAAGKSASIATLAITGGATWRFAIAPPRRQKC